jgi:PST family polysaccharide transporter
LTTEFPAAPGFFRRRLLRNTVATGVANAWAMVVAVASLPFLLHGLGATAFGTWAILQTFSAISGWLSLADLGTGLAATRAIADHASRDEEHDRDLAVGTTLALSAAIGVVFVVVFATIGSTLFLGAFDVPESLHAAVRVAVPAFGLQIFLELVAGGAGACLDGLQRIDRSRLADAVRRTAIAVAASVTALAGGGLQGVAIASASATAAGLVFALVLLRHELGRLPVRPGRTMGGGLLRYGRSVWALAMTGVLHRTMDRLIVGVVIGPTAVALVEIANQVQNGVAAVLSAASYTVTSGAAWVEGRGDHHRVRELVVRGTRYACLATLPLCALVAVLATPVISVWVGASHIEAADLVRLAVLYLATQAPLAASTNVLIGVGRAGSVVGPAWVAVVTNLVASIALVEWFGVAGSFVATIISSLVLDPLLVHLVRVELGVQPRELLRAVRPSVLPVATAAAVAALVLATPWPTGVVAGVGAAGGLAAAAVSGFFVIGGSERRELARGLSR